MTHAPYTINILQVQNKAVKVEIQRLPDAPAIPIAPVSPSIGLHILTEGYWFLKEGSAYDHDRLEPDIRQRIEASPFKRQLDYWAKLMLGEATQLSLKESNQLSQLNRRDFALALQQQDANAFIQRGQFFYLYKGRKLKDFVFLAKSFIPEIKTLSEEGTTLVLEFEVYKEGMSAHLIEGLTWHTLSFDHQR